MKRFLAFVVLAFATTAATANQSPGNWICEDPLFVQDAILEIEGTHIQVSNGPRG